MSIDTLNPIHSEPQDDCNSADSLPLPSNLDELERVLGGEYVRYYVVNQIGNPVAPYGVAGNPLTLDQAKKLCQSLRDDKPQHGWQVEECCIHISCIYGYGDLHPSSKDYPTNAEALHKACMGKSIGRVNADIRRNRLSSKARRRKKHYKRRHLAKYSNPFA